MKDEYVAGFDPANGSDEASLTIMKQGEVITSFRGKDAVGIYELLKAMGFSFGPPLLDEVVSVSGMSTLKALINNGLPMEAVTVNVELSGVDSETTITTSPRAAQDIRFGQKFRLVLTEVKE